MGKNKKYKLILGSKSPRRVELIGTWGIPFEQVVSSCEEHSDSKDSAQFAVDIANLKLNDIWNTKLSDEKKQNSLLLCSDTIVVIQDQILGKPKDHAEWKSFLELFCAKTHYVITAVSFKSLEFEFSFYEKTDVSFGHLSQELIERYLKTDDGLDKAGGYGVQSMGQMFIEKISGSYTNVVGLPLFQTYENLLKVSERKSLADLFEV